MPAFFIVMFGLSYGALLVVSYLSYGLAGLWGTSIALLASAVFSWLIDRHWTRKTSKTEA